MSNEERLENIKILMKNGHLIQLRRGQEIFNTVNWLIQQTERAFHLERKYENTGSMFGRQAQRTLIDENKRLREALDFYANKENYEVRKIVGDSNINYSKVDIDTGVKARKSLEDTQ